MASPAYDGRASQESRLLARALERNLRDSGLLDMEALCVAAGRKVQPFGACTVAGFAEGAWDAQRSKEASSPPTGVAPACTSPGAQPAQLWHARHGGPLPGCWPQGQLPCILHCASLHILACWAGFAALERNLRNSGMLDMEALCVADGRKVRPSASCTVPGFATVACIAPVCTAFRREAGLTPVLPAGTCLRARALPCNLRDSGMLDVEALCVAAGCKVSCLAFCTVHLHSLAVLGKLCGSFACSRAHWSATCATPACSTQRVSVVLLAARKGSEELHIGRLG